MTYLEEIKERFAKTKHTEDDIRWLIAEVESMAAIILAIPIATLEQILADINFREQIRTQKEREEWYKKNPNLEE